MRAIPLVLFCLTLARLLAPGAFIGHALVAVALLSYEAFTLYLESIRVPPPIPINDQIREELEVLKTTVQALKIGRGLQGQHR